MGSIADSENEAQRARLRALIERLTDADLGRSLGGGWTVATALAHLSFWDRRAAIILGRWQRGETPREAEWESDVLNEVLEPQWAVLPPREAARLAIEAAQAIDERSAKADGGLVATLEAADQSWLLNRSRHRAEHIAQIESVLS